MNNSSGGSSKESNLIKSCDQGVKPKVRNFISNTESEICTSVHNGNTSYSKEFNNTHGSPSTSFLMPPSSFESSSQPPSSSACLNQVFVDKQNGECSGEKCSAKGRTLSSEENDLRNHDKKRKTGCILDSDSSSENEEEGLSGDDCCIYTYKGDQFADLPNSFFSVDMVVNGDHQALREDHRKANARKEVEDHERNNLGSSPEMDYLEMDFDPGPFFEQDSEEDLNGFERKIDDSPVPELSNELFVNDKNEEDPSKVAAKTDIIQDSNEFQPGPSGKNSLQCPAKRQTEVSDYNSNSFNRTNGFLSSCCAGFCVMDESGEKCCTTKEGVNVEKTENGVNNLGSRTSVLSGERLKKKVLPIEENDFGASVNKKSEVDSKLHFDGIMLWSEQEAVSKQVTLVSSEISCAAAAVINVMLALKMRISIEKVQQGISTRLKTESALIPQYLVSRSYAGIAHENLIRGIHHASHGLLYARFFQMYPRRDVILSKWLVHWMKKGAVPIATMNVQRDSASEDSALDIRHHQMIFGVNNKGIYLTNPLECLQEEELWSRLISPSVLKIKRSEIVSRWTPNSNLKPLMFQNDVRWKEMNVLGQVVNIIREFLDPGAQGKFLTQYITIPASSGITLVIPRHSPAYEELASTSDLPLLSNLTTK